MKLVSWNVNGLRACVSKGDFFKFFDEIKADIFCLQETKMQIDQINFDLPQDYHLYMNSAVKKGYSGTAIFSKIEPLNVTYGLNIEYHDQEGRVICAEYEKFYLVCCYTPNSKDGLLRLDYRMEWEDAFRDYLLKLNKKKPVVLCGDLNVAHNEIDLKNPDTNHFNAGFSDEERSKMSELLNAGFIDTYRYFYPNKTNQYSWWSYRGRARENNAGWRIDYFIVSQDFKDNIKDSIIHDSIKGSDHCPVELIIEI